MIAPSVEVMEPPTIAGGGAGGEGPLPLEPCSAQGGLGVAPRPSASPAAALGRLALPCP